MEEWFHINQLFVRYATALDRGDVEGVVECFTADGTIDSPVLGRFGGHAGVREFALRTERMLRQHGAQFRHVVSNLRADVDGDTARATCYLHDFLTRDGRTELLSPGEYDCRLRREGGRWRFVHRLVRMDQSFPPPDGRGAHPRTPTGSDAPC